MSDIAGVDSALDRLDEAVSDLTTNTNVAVLKRLAQLAKEPDPSRAMVDQVHEITMLCSAAQAALSSGLERINEEEDEHAMVYLDHALAHLESMSGMIDDRVAPEPTEPAKRAAKVFEF